MKPKPRRTPVTNAILNGCIGKAITATRPHVQNPGVGVASSGPEHLLDAARTVPSAGIVFCIPATGPDSSVPYAEAPAAEALPAIPNPRVAVLLSGQIRTLAQTWEAWRKALVEPYSADVYYFGSEMERWDEVRGLIAPRAFQMEVDPDLPEYDWQGKMGPGNHSAQALLRQQYGIMRVYGMSEKTYDWYVRLRPDLELLKPPEDLRTLSPDALYLPRFSNWGVTRSGGCHDRFAMVPNRWADAYFRRYERLEEYMAQTGSLHAETFLRWCLSAARVSVRRTDVLFNTLRMNGDREKPYWDIRCGDVLREAGEPA